jgi:PKD domain
VLKAFWPLLVAAVLVSVPNAFASTVYDPDAFSFGVTAPSADLTVSSGTCTFDTITGAISGAGCTSARSAGGDGTLLNGIGVHVVPGSGGAPDTTEFVMRSLAANAGSLITYVGSNNLAIATLHDLTVSNGGAVNVDGLGAAGGSPGDAGGGFGGGDHSILQNCPDSGGGGSFGGLGGDGGNGVPSGGIYGTGDQSQLLYQGSGGGGAGLGSGCGTVPGGDGGGGVALIAMGTLTLDGTVSADGEPASLPGTLTDQGGPGGGSGGAILLMAPHLVLANQSVAQAKGGFGRSTSVHNGSGGGGGGGGRITAVSDQPSTAFSMLSVGGGLGGDTTDPGTVGLVGGEGNGGSLGGLPFLTVSGPASKQAGQVAAFFASQAFGDSTFSWDFGDGGTGSGQTPSHTYAAAGTYTVTVTATLADSGATATAQRSIHVTAAPAAPGGGSTPPGPTVPPAPGPAATQCIVPKLKGLSLSAARTKLTRAHCKLGKVKKPKLRNSAKKPSLVVAHQSRPAGAKLANGSAVGVTLAAKKPQRRHRH